MKNLKQLKICKQIQMKDEKQIGIVEEEMIEMKK
jgi:hypothetical protein